MWYIFGLGSCSTIYLEIYETLWKANSLSRRLIYNESISNKLTFISKQYAA